MSSEKWLFCEWVIEVFKYAKNILTMLCIHSMRHIMKSVRCLRAIHLCSETGFLTHVPSADWHFQWHHIMVENTDFLFFSDRHMHDVISVTHFYLYPHPLLFFITSYQVDHVSLPKRLLERPSRFRSPFSKALRTARMTFCQVIANSFKTSLKVISFSIYKLVHVVSNGVHSQLPKLLLQNNL